MEVYEIVYKIRNMRNLTRKEVASITGISNDYYGQLESCGKSPRPKTLLKIANGLNFPMDVYFKDEDKQYLVNAVIALIMMTPGEELQAVCESLESCKSLKFN